MDADRCFALVAAAKEYNVVHLTMGPEQWDVTIRSLARRLPFTSASGADDFTQQAIATGEIMLDGVKLSRRASEEYV